MKNLYLCCFLLIFCCSCIHQTGSSEKKLENPDYKKAIVYRDSKNADSAFFYFNQAKDVFLQHGDSLGVGKCLVNMAIISTNHGDNFGGQELSLNAISYFSSDSLSHYPYLQSNYNNLGIASFQLKEYQKAIVFYQNTLIYTKDSLSAFVAQNNIANAYQKLGSYPVALSIYRSILKHDILPGDYSRVLSNEAYTQWLQNPKANVAGKLLTALQIRQSRNDGYGESASYGYLSDVYLQSNPDSALFYAKKMDTLSRELDIPDDRLDALQKLVKLSNPEASKAYFKVYQHLEDSLQTARSAAKNQFALIRYETEKHKADKMKLQKEKTERNGWIVCLFIFIGVSSGFILFWNKSRRERLLAATEKAIRDSQLKTSKKVHDVVANGLYRIMSAMEYQEEIPREQLLDEMETLYEQSRDISYEDAHLLRNETADFSEAMTKLLSAFANENTKVLISGNSPMLWKRVSPTVKFEITQVFQELMVNMKKHSRANYVVIRFAEVMDELSLFYKDNGKGLAANYEEGNGLRNTGNRINEIGGTINFVNGPKGGLEVRIQLPLPN